MALAKKVAMGVTHVIIDIPAGPGAKVRDARAAQAMVDRFAAVAQRLGLQVACKVTAGGRPLGRAVGPVLEAREVLAFLEAGGQEGELQRKSLALAAALLEMGGKAPTGQGEAVAKSILVSGKARQKFLDIIRAQGGDATVQAAGLHPGPHWFDALAVHAGPFEIGTQALVAIARAAGAPQAKRAGILLARDVGSPAQVGDALFRVYAEAPARLDNAWEAVQRLTGLQCRAESP
jgi:AMP phosphorylase